MIEIVDGEIYRLQADTIEEIRDCAEDFFADGTHENDLIAVDGYMDEPVYLSSTDLKNGMIDDDCYVNFSVKVFKDARRNRHLINGGIVPALNEFGEPVCLLRLRISKNHFKGYFHRYKQVKGKPDSRVFMMYDIVVFMEVSEYAFILLKDVLAEYEGRVICVGKGWYEFLRFFPDRTNIEYIEEKEKIPPDVLFHKTMYLSEFCSITAGSEERYRSGFFSFDEIMTLVYFFSIRTSCGNKNPEKKYYLIDPMFSLEGLMSVCDKVQALYAYAEANGYIPVIRITQSEGIMYSDFDGEDIWGKFFDQPYGEEAEEWKESKNVWIFPRAAVTLPARWLMGRISGCGEAQLLNTFYMNERVRKEIDDIRETILPDPKRTIGVLIRGTDYTISHLAGHAIMASPEQVMEKIKEFEAGGGYDYIFLSTEDEDILEKMKEFCGKRLRFTDQKRFRIRPGELLVHHKGGRENDGWLRGKEYLTTLQLLSECGAFVASGRCCGTLCALNSGSDNFRDCFVFDLGYY